MYQVNYYLNDKMYTVERTFSTAWVATYKARAIYDEHGIPTDVVDMTTGEVIAIFAANNCYLADFLYNNTVSAIIKEWTTS